MTYHYKESGLDDVFLENGFARHETPYGEGVSIEDGAGLHQAIGRWLVERPAPLSGAELRFLRLEMELTQRDLAGILGTTEQTLRLWEKGRAKVINAMADRLVRMLYADTADLRGDQRTHVMLQRLADVGDRVPGESYFRRARRAWKLRRIPAKAAGMTDQVSA